MILFMSVARMSCVFFGLTNSLAPGSPVFRRFALLLMIEICSDQG
jgi:hypothetical protein